MISRLYASVALIVLSTLPVEATTLKGIIRVNEASGQPMANVQVGAIEANATSSDSLGMFTLEFPKKHPGDTVRLVVSREGYEVVNGVQVSELTLSNPVEARIVTILLCREGSREEMARRYYQLKSIEAIEETYKRRLKELEEKQQATAEALAKLEQQREEAIGAAGKAAEELAKQKAGEISELYGQAMRLFLDAKVDEALEILSGEKLQRMAAEAKKRKAEAEKAIEEAVQAWLLRARLLTVQFQFSEAAIAYREAIETSPDSFEANFAYAGFSQSLNRVDEAEAAYKRCLKIAKETGKDADCAATLNNLGMLYTDQNWLSGAVRAFTEALKIYGETPSKEPEARASYGASTLNNRGIVYQKDGQMQAARKDFEEALHTYQDLAREHGDAYLPDLARTLNNLGVLNQQEGQTEEARRNFEEALQIHRALAQKNSETYSPDVATTLNNVATTLNNLGVLDRAQDRLEEARKNFEEALQIRRALTQKNPDAYRLDLALTLNNLGDLSRAQNRVKESRREFEDALQCYNTLAKQDPKRFSSEVERVKKVLEELQKTQAP